MLEVSRTPSASRSSPRVAPRRSNLTAKVWRRVMGETRHIPTWWQRFQMAFCTVLEVVTGLAARPIINSGVSASRIRRQRRRGRAGPAERRGGAGGRGRVGGGAAGARGEVGAGAAELHLGGFKV